VNSFRYASVAAILFLAGTLSAVAQTKATNSVTVVYRDKHQQTYTSAEVSRIDLRNEVLVVNRGGREEQIPLSKVARIEMNEGPSDIANSRSHFIGKWEVGGANGTAGYFNITLDRDGKARKTINHAKGTWTFVNGEAQIAWEDGWHDVIAQVGNKYEKRAYEPGKPLTDTPSSVSTAKRANDQSI
jgi:hypothetical protein